MKRFFCYMIVIINNNKITNNYIGFTTNPSRRIKQHNQILKGGAKATKKSTNWQFLFIVEGFKNMNEALSCEWKLKHPNNKYNSNYLKRLCVLDNYLKLIINLLLNVNRLIKMIIILYISILKYMV